MVQRFIFTRVLAFLAIMTLLVAAAGVAHADPVTAPQPLPEPDSLALVGLAMVAALRVALRRKAGRDRQSRD